MSQGDQIYRVLQSISDFDHWVFINFAVKPRILSALMVLKLSERAMTKTEIDAYLNSSNPDTSGPDFGRMCRKFSGESGSYVMAEEVDGKFALTEEGHGCLDLIAEEFSKRIQEGA
ncbi:hypothetical protein [Ferrimonas balearica]|uniref:hypothetical protein n=1 Tax=Ferrimonas balearica TaxID=44012 RepID=UPI001F397391|nr:hypothetical protein [Ferrimonas balearica]MBY6093823.1 hypothetical protein [Ferrimonas balearica]